MSATGTAPWQQWARRPEMEGTLAERARGRLPEMESTKQLVRLVAAAYRPGMTVLDAGCNAGHYLRGLRRLDAGLAYTGVDAYAHYIDQAREIYAEDPYARFEVRDLRQPLALPEAPFDIAYCCNVLLHLPDFRGPVRHLLQAARRVAILRTLLAHETTIVKKALTQRFDEAGEPLDYVYKNTWQVDYVRGFIEDLGWRTTLVADEFDPSALQRDNDAVKGGQGTGVLGGRQIDGVSLFNWQWLVCTRTEP
jgi:2-polyprenyl-3-methyl-5-hydroxy-6-metoxy-1,4-benzoquinol methylase